VSTNFNVKIRIPILNAQGYNDELIASATTAFQSSVRIFAQTVASLMHVETGMAKASLQGITDEVGGGFSARGISTFKGTSRKRIGYTDIHGTYHKSPNRSYELGRTMGEGTNNGIQFYPTLGILRFNWKILVYQHLRWDSEWGSIEAGQTAMMANITRQRIKLPSLKLHMKEGVTSNGR
jgi:hypothetical protein